MEPRDYTLVVNLDIDLDSLSPGAAELPAGLESGQVVIEAGRSGDQTWWRVREARPDDDDDGPVLLDLEDAGDPLERLLAFLGVASA
jgi:hypothetical protein